MSEQHLTALRSVPIFACLDEAGLAAVADIATEFEARQDHVLIELGQASSGCFVILEGTVEVSLPSGRTVQRGAGQFFGELSVLIDSPRTARVKVVSDMTGLAIGRDDLLALLEREPTIAVAMLREMAHRLADATRM